MYDVHILPTTSTDVVLKASKQYLQHSMLLSQKTLKNQFQLGKHARYAIFNVLFKNHFYGFRFNSLKFNFVKDNQSSASLCIEKKVSESMRRERQVLRSSCVQYFAIQRRRR